MEVQVQSLSLRKSLQGAWPVVDHFLRRLQLTQSLTQSLRSSRYANALSVLVTSVLLQPNALYRIAAWAQAYDSAWRPSPPPNDDLLGRALDRLFDADRATLLTTLIVQAVHAFDVATDQIHTRGTRVNNALLRPNPGNLCSPCQISSL